MDQQYMIICLSLLLSCVVCKRQDDKSHVGWNVNVLRHHSWAKGCPVFLSGNAVVYAVSRSPMSVSAVSPPNHSQSYFSLMCCQVEKKSALRPSESLV